jgi:hypothetical protein
VDAEITTDRIFVKLRPILVSYGREQPANFPRKTTTREPGDAQREAKKLESAENVFRFSSPPFRGPHAGEILTKPPPSMGRLQVKLSRVLPYNPTQCYLDKRP